MAARSHCLNVIAFLAAVVTSGPARAEETSPQHTLKWNAHPEQEAAADTAEPAKKRERNEGAAGALDDAQLMPFTVGAPIARATAVVKGLGGYDSTTQSARARTAVEASVFDFLAVRAEYEHGPGTGSDDRVKVGARVAVLNEKKHGIDGGFGFAYDAKDFRNEGTFIGGLLLGRHFGRLGLYGNALFGMDSEGDDAAAEFRLGTGYRLAPMFQFGFDTRGRFNFSSDEKRANAQAIDWEVQAGPTGAVSFGPIALLAMVGPSFLKVTEPGDVRAHLSSGVLAMGGAGAAF